MSQFHSLRKNSDFSKVFSCKKSYANRMLIMYTRKNPENAEAGLNRVGISVSKKVGNSVIRHRVKRVIREIFRLNDAIFSKGLDIVIIARVEAKKAGYQELESAVMHLCRLHGMISRREELREK
ncbi:MAG: ribonuclease P protein component [Lachnospiraceae bacterium]|nr:ribonuclease P protein component [Lachnospiraceae bacterium]